MAHNTSTFWQDQKYLYCINLPLETINSTIELIMYSFFPKRKSYLVNEISTALLEYDMEYCFDMAHAL